MAVTIQDLADRLGVSCATVSMALNGRPGVSPATRGRVEALARELGYTGGRAPGSRDSLCFFVYRRYGRVVADTQFFSQLIEAVENTARGMGYGLSLLYCDGEGELPGAIQSVERSGAGGLLLLATELTEEDFVPFASLPIPIVAMDCDLRGTGADTILIDNREGMLLAVEHLARLGHRQVGYLHSSFSIRNFEQRRQGYLEGAERFGFAPAVFSLGPTLEEAYRDMAALLASGISLPTALAADNDLIALGAMRAMKHAGLRLPQDVSLTGFDDVPLCMLSDPELTSSAVDRQALGSLAVRRLVERMKGEQGPGIKLVVPLSLSVRGSSCPPKGDEGK